MSTAKEANFISSIPYDDRTSMAQYVIQIFVDCLKLVDLQEIADLEPQSLLTIELVLHVSIWNPTQVWTHIIEEKKFKTALYKNIRKLDDAKTIIKNYPNGSLVSVLCTQGRSIYGTACFDYCTITQDVRNKILKRLCSDNTSLRYALTVISCVLEQSNSKYKTQITCKVLQYGILQKIKKSKPTYEILRLLSEMASYSDCIKPLAIELKLVEDYLLEVNSKSLELCTLCCIYNIFRIQDGKSKFNDGTVRFVVRRLVSICIEDREEHYPVTDYCIYFFSCLCSTPKYHSWIAQYKELGEFLKTNREAFTKLHKHIDFIIASCFEDDKQTHS